MTTKTWTQTEQQGPGRRYWHETAEEARAHAAARAAAGYSTFFEGCTSWVSFGKKATRRTRAVLAGLDPLSQ
jgi:hypothetical protein